VRANMPDGCSIRDLGSYGDVRHVIAVFCDGRRTSSLNYEQSASKSSNSMTSVSFHER
jgi:hypothetical protein